MNHESRLQQIQRKIAQNYRNANGRVVRRASGSQYAQALDPIDRKITVNIAPIDSTVAGACRVFGYFISPDETYNTTNNMTVDIPESSHQFVKRLSAAKPFRIKGVLYTPSVAAQLSNPFVFNFRSGYGAVDQRTWQPASYDDPMYQKTNQIKTSELQYVVDGNTDIEISFNAQATASIVFTVIDVLDHSQLLDGKTPLKSI